MNLEDVMFAARVHADSLANDIELTATREEHIRITARANEAETIAQALYELHISQLAADTLG